MHAQYRAQTCLPRLTATTTTVTSFGSRACGPQQLQRKPSTLIEGRVASGQTVHEWSNYVQKFCKHSSQRQPCADGISQCLLTLCHLTNSVIIFSLHEDGTCLVASLLPEHARLAASCRLRWCRCVVFDKRAGIKGESKQGRRISPVRLPMWLTGVCVELSCSGDRFGIADPHSRHTDRSTGK